jgi:CBS domain-containing protein
LTWGTRRDEANTTPVARRGRGNVKTVGMLLEEKGRELFSVAPATPVFAALELMAEKNCGALLVIDDASGLVGMFSERDYARKIILKGKASKDTPVREIMTSDVVCIDTGRSLDECMALMTGKRIRHLPVLEQGKLAGVISIGDVVKSVISEQEFIIEQLQSYITGGY